MSGIESLGCRQNWQMEPSGRTHSLRATSAHGRRALGDRPILLVSCKHHLDEAANPNVQPPEIWHPAQLAGVVGLVSLTNLTS